MKKIFALALCLCVVLAPALYGCQPGQEKPPVTQPTGPDTEAPGTETPGTEAPDPEAPGKEPLTPAVELSGSLEEILAGIVAQAGVEIGMTFDERVTEESSQGVLGLSATQMEEYVEEALASSAAITVHAHLAAIVKCVDAEAAAQVKTLIADHFDSGRWVCVRPEQSLVVEAGQYVMLVSSDANTAQGLLKGFEALAGETVGEANIFYNGEG